MTSWLRHRVWDPLLALLLQGVQPARLAWCVAIGVVVGNIPILGVSTILCTLIALACGLNLPAIQLVQALMAPTQLLLIIPFVRLGEWLMGAAPQPVSIGAALALLRQGVWHAVVVLKEVLLHAGLAWLLVAPFAAVLLVRILTPIFTHAAAALPRRAPAAPLPLDCD